MRCLFLTVVFRWFNFLKHQILSHKQANLESLPPHVPSYFRAAVGPPSSTARRHFCTVCGFSSSYACVRCGMRFCSTRCQNIHNDTRCLKFVAWSVRAFISSKSHYYLLESTFGFQLSIFKFLFLRKTPFSCKYSSVSLADLFGKRRRCWLVAEQIRWIFPC